MTLCAQLLVTAHEDTFTRESVDECIACIRVATQLSSFVHLIGQCLTPVCCEGTLDLVKADLMDDAADGVIVPTNALMTDKAARYNHRKRQRYEAKPPSEKEKLRKAYDVSMRAARRKSSKGLKNLEAGPVAKAMRGRTSSSRRCEHGMNSGSFCCVTGIARTWCPSALLCIRVTWPPNDPLRLDLCHGAEV